MMVKLEPNRIIQYYELAKLYNKLSIFRKTKISRTLDLGSINDTGMDPEEFTVELWLRIFESGNLNRFILIIGELHGYK